MEASEFDRIVEKRTRLIKNVLASKSIEYASGKDRLHNFKRAAETLRTTPEKALVGMFTKHLISILDIVDAVETDAPAVNMIEEKIGDAINYLILLEGLLKERIDKNFEKFLSEEDELEQVTGTKAPIDKALDVAAQAGEAFLEKRAESVKAYFVDGDSYLMPNVQEVSGGYSMNGVLVFIPEGKKFTHVTVTRDRKSAMVHYA